VARQKRRLTGAWTYGLGAACTLMAAGTVTIFSLLTQLHPEPWYHPRYALPVLGMILGNTMTGVSLGLDVLTNGLVREQAAVEACLALGGTRYQALLPVLRDALRSGFMPTINGMAAIGLVSLPGMMTGQILAGVEPVDAVKYQLLIMFLIAGGTGLGTLAAGVGGVYRVTDHPDRLRLGRVKSGRLGSKQKRNAQCGRGSSANGMSGEGSMRDRTGFNGVAYACECAGSPSCTCSSIRWWRSPDWSAGSTWMTTSDR